MVADIDLALIECAGGLRRSNSVTRVAHRNGAACHSDTYFHVRLNGA
jgi:hypothetical protein